MQNILSVWRRLFTWAKMSRLRNSKFTM